jgi:hypothetical protein
LPHFAQAALQVTFEATPLFVGANVVPGDSVTRTVTVTNTGTEAEEVIFSLENTFSDGRADVMEISVISGADVFVDTDFIDLFGVDEIPLGPLGPASSKVYEFSSSLSPAVGNSYQLTNLGFDLLIGFADGETIIDNPPSGGRGGGGGSGSLFSLFNEEVVVVENSDVNLTWNTNQPATSYAVCGNDEDGPFVLDPADRLFGYVFSSTENTAKSLTHTVDFQDLAVGEYSCRVASREGTKDDFTVSGELNFEILPGGLIAGVTDSQPIIQGNYFQPRPTVAGISDGGKGSFQTYEEFRAELDALKAAQEAEKENATSTNDSVFISPVVVGDDFMAPVQESNSRWYLYLLGLLVLAMIWWASSRQS